MGDEMRQMGEADLAQMRWHDAIVPLIDTAHDVAALNGFGQKVRRAYRDGSTSWACLSQTLSAVGTS